MSASYQFIKIFLDLLNFCVVLHFTPLCSCVVSYDWILELLCVVLSYVVLSGLNLYIYCFQVS